MLQFFHSLSPLYPRPLLPPLGKRRGRKAYKQSSVGTIQAVTVATVAVTALPGQLSAFSAIGSLPTVHFGEIVSDGKMVTTLLARTV